METLRAQVWSIAFVVAVAFATAASAQDFPNKPVSIVVPAPPGGSIDIFARQLAELVQPDLKQRFLIENKPGAGGSIGVRSVVAAPPDGYTLGFVWDGPLTTIPHSIKVPYTPDSYAPLMSFGYSAYTICARPEFPAQDTKEFVAKLKQSPGNYTLGLDSVGGTMHLAAVRIFAKLGVNVRYVPYGGATEVLKGFLSKDVDLYGSSIAPILPQITAGRAKCLLITSASSNPVLPQTPGLDALGLGSEETVLWWGVIAPAKTPPAILQTLEAALTKAANTEKFRELVARQGGTMQILNGAEMAQRIRKDLAALAQAAKAAGVEQH
jgi:tripartite-type tricarboxylate transporter receptor subunit TctC